MLAFNHWNRSGKYTQMFLEPGTHPNYQSGWIEVICGCMFSGKTEELIRRLRRAEIAGQKVKVFKPAIEDRYHKAHVVSHDQRAFEAIPLNRAAEMLNLCEDAQVIGIDEAQFFEPDVVEVANALANTGKRVVVAGLDLDYKGQPFGPMPQLMATAEFVTKVHAICKRTGQLAHYSHRISQGNELIELGQAEAYEPVSRQVFNELNRDQNAH